MEIEPRHARHASKMILLGLFAIYSGYSRIREKRKSQDVPHGKIRSLSSGKVKIAGVARSFETTYSPLSKTPCSMWVVSFEKIRLNSWIPFSSTFDCPSWYLDDKNGSKIWLDPDKASLKGKAHKTETVYPWSSKPHVEEFASSMGFAPRVLGIFKTFRVREYIVESGEKIELIGEAVPLQQYSSNDEVEGFSKLVVSNGPMSEFIVYKDGAPVGRDWWAFLLLFGGGLFVFGGLILTGALIDSGLSGTGLLIAAFLVLFTVAFAAYYLTGFHRRKELER